MSKAFFFWLLMVLWALGIVGIGWVPETHRGRVFFGGGLLLFALLFLLGWKTYGFIIAD